MNKTAFSGLFFPAIAGLFFFLKKPYTEDMYLKGSEKNRVLSEDDKQRTGVARYIEKQIPLVHSEKKPLENLALSGVAKYIKDQENFKLSSVARYTLRIKIAERKAGLAVQKIDTGVDKYLKNLPIMHKVSGVSRYLKIQEGKPKASSVSKYITRIKYADTAISIQPSVPCATSVTRYLKLQENLPKLSGVSKYLVKQSLLKKKVDIKHPLPSATGVSKYLQNIENIPKKTTVERYIKLQEAAAIDKSPLVELSTVEKYIQSRT